jgi:Mce-associated membrane protein
VPEPAAAAGDRATGDTATGDTAIGDTATGDAVPADVPDEPVAGVAVIGEDEPAGTDTDTDTADDDDEDDEDEPAEPAGTTPRRGSSLVLPVALLVVAVVLGGLGAFFFAQARGVRSSTAASNTALVDSARTSEVNGQVQDAVEKAFSYDFSDIVATEKAADEVLTGRARCQYGVVFEPVRTLAPEQKLVVTTKAVTSGVTVLDDDRATALVFVDQVTTRTTDNQTGGGVGMLRASAERVDGRWKITDLVMFGQTADQQGQMSQCQ